jgi:hypothetical protein
MGGIWAFRPVAGEGRRRVLAFSYCTLSQERNVEMLEFMGSPIFMIIMGVLLVGLIILFIYLRKTGGED